MEFQPEAQAQAQTQTQTQEQEQSQEQSQSQPQPQPQELQQEIPINKIPVTDQNIALQLLVAFVQLGHRRGAYNIEETAKIHECVEMFKVQEPNKE